MVVPLRNKHEIEQKQIEFVDDVKQKCNNEFIKAELVYLFGSHANQTQTNFSDIDFAFLFDSKFDNHKLFNIRLDLISSLQKKIKKDVDVIILNLAPPLLKFEAINGILLYKRNEKIRVEFEVKTIDEYLDTKYLRKVNSHYLFKRISEYNV